MTLTDTLLFVHILAAATWMGGAMVNMIYLSLAADFEDLGYTARIVRKADFLGPRLFGGSLLIALLTGIWLVYDGPWAFSDLWVSIGFTGWIVSMGIGGAVHSKQGGKILPLCEAGDGAGVTAAMQKWRMVARVDMVIVLIVIAAMVYKPGA